MSHLPHTFRLATSSNDGLHWKLPRNCSVTPRQMLVLFLSLCGVSLAVAGFFWTQGATLVLPFTAIELFAVGTAFLVYARHATDRELISICQGRLVVEQESAGRTLRREFSRYAVRVEAPQERDWLIEVHGSGQMVRVGRFLRADLRPVLLREIRMALKS